MDTAKNYNITYGELINKIKEIIIDGYNKYAILSLTDNFNYSEYFDRILWFNIELEKTSELRELLDLERTFYLLFKNNDPTLNRELLAICKRRSKNKTSKTEDYIALANILEDAFATESMLLTEYKGYYVKREALHEFISLCRKLNVGPSVLVRKVAKDYLQEEIDTNHKAMKLQYKRICKYLDMDILNDDHRDVYTKNKKGKEVEAIARIRNSDDKLFVDLAKLGIVSSQGFTILGTILGPIKFRSIIGSLAKEKVFNEDTLKGIVVTSTSGLNPENIDFTTDELIALFIYHKDYTVNSLKTLYFSIGYNRFKALLDALHIYESITDNVYTKLNHWLENKKEQEHTSIRI